MKNKIKVSEATGQVLDYLVAKCENVDPQFNRVAFGAPWSGWWITTPKYERLPNYSTDWSQGGPIIERDGIELLCNLTATEAARFSGGAKADWQAFHRSDRRTDARQYGPTPLIAAMRCYVANKLGDEVEVPEELCLTVSSMNNAQNVLS